MLRPRRMARVVASGSQDHLERTVEILHDVNAVHLIEHEAGDDDVAIGDPMERGEELSEHLVVLRSAKEQLDITEDNTPTRRFSVDEIEEELQARVFDLKTNLNSLQEDRERIEEVLRDLDSELDELAPYADLALDAEQYRGYETVTCLTGRLDADPLPLLEDAGIEGGVFSGGDVHAVFVGSEDAEAAREVLSAAGWASLEPPGGEGSVADRVEELREERERFEAKLEEIEERRRQLRESHGPFLLAAEEHLGIEVEKSEAPMQFASTDNAFVLEGWVPDERVDEVQRRLDEEFGGAVYVETLEVETKHVHHEEPQHEEEPPTDLQNEGPARPFEFVTNLMSRPTYDEIDPTILLTIFFPLLFGLMIGDVGYGVAIVGLGYYLRNNKIFGIGGAHVGNVLIMCGISTIAFGFVMFQEMFGLHFFYPPGEVEHIGHVMHEHHFGSVGETISFLAHEGEFIPPTWAGLLMGTEEAFHLSEGIAYGPSWLRMPLVKLNALQELMQVSIWMALIHMTLGFVIGFINERDHLGPAKAFAGQAGWTLVMWGWFFAIVVAMLGPALGLTYIPTEWFPAFISLPGVQVHSFNLGLTLVGIGAVGLAFAEPEGIVELFGVLSNLVSYARLAAIGISKAGFVFVFNVIAFQTMGGGIAAVGVLVVAHVIVFALGLISSGVQTLRLNFYEFFSKFFEGGGAPYHPFGRKREYTET